MTRIRDKIGVCLQPDTTGPIGQIGKVVDAMRYLRLDTIRIRAPIVGADSWRRIYQPLGKANMRFVFTHKGGRDTMNEVNDLAEFNDLYPNQILGYEGPNEPDIHPVTFDGVTDRRRSKGVSPTFRAALALMAAQRDALWSVLPDVPLIAFNDRAQGQQAAVADMANTHIYPGKGRTLAHSAGNIAKLVAQHGRGKIVITEWGYTTGAGRMFAEVTPARKAANLGKDIALVMGKPEIERAFVYTLVSYPTTGELDNFGLFDPTWEPTPAAEAIRAMTA